LNRISLAFRSFFGLLFGGALPESVLSDLRLTAKAAAPPPKPAAPAAPVVKTSDGALQFLGILQRDARLVDFLMEDISGYADDQVGAAVRQLHNDARDSVSRYFALQPVIDGVEGTYAKAPGDAALVKFTGNVPAKTPAGGTLRHRGWRASKAELPNLGKMDAALIAPAEIEIE
jgi:hypothetical protein